MSLSKQGGLLQGFTAGLQAGYKISLQKAQIETQNKQFQSNMAMQDEQFKAGLKLKQDQLTHALETKTKDDDFNREKFEVNTELRRQQLGATEANTKAQLALSKSRIDQTNQLAKEGHKIRRAGQDIQKDSQNRLEKSQDFQEKTTTSKLNLVLKNSLTIANKEARKEKFKSNANVEKLKKELDKEIVNLKRAGDDAATSESGVIADKHIADAKKKHDDALDKYKQALELDKQNDDDVASTKIELDDFKNNQLKEKIKKNFPKKEDPAVEEDNLVEEEGTLEDDALDEAPQEAPPEDEAINEGPALIDLSGQGSPLETILGQDPRFAPPEDEAVDQDQRSAQTENEKIGKAQGIQPGETLEQFQVRNSKRIQADIAKGEIETLKKTHLGKLSQLTDGQTPVDERLKKSNINRHKKLGLPTTYGVNIFTILPTDRQIGTGKSIGKSSPLQLVNEPANQSALSPELAKEKAKNDFVTGMLKANKRFLKGTIDDPNPETRLESFYRGELDSPDEYQRLFTFKGGQSLYKSLIFDFKNNRENKIGMRSNTGRDAIIESYVNVENLTTTAIDQMTNQSSVETTPEKVALINAMAMFLGTRDLRRSLEKADAVMDFATDRQQGINKPLKAVTKLITGSRHETMNIVKWGGITNKSEMKSAFKKLDNFREVARKEQVALGTRGMSTREFGQTIRNRANELFMADALKKR